MKRHDIHPAGPFPFTLNLCQDNTHIPVVLSVIVSVSVVLIILSVESIIVTPVSIIEITVALRKEKEEWWWYMGLQKHNPQLPIIEQDIISSWYYKQGKFFPQVKFFQMNILSGQTLKT